MNIEKLLKALYENPTDISIQYSNINGIEQLIINGELIDEVENEIFEKIDTFKENLRLLPDYVFDEVIETLKNNIELNKFNTLLEKEELNEEEVQYIESHIKYVNSVIKDTMAKKVKELASLANKF